MTPGRARDMIISLRYCQEGRLALDARVRMRRKSIFATCFDASPPISPWGAPITHSRYSGADKHAARCMSAYAAAMRRIAVRSSISRLRTQARR